MGSNAAMVPSFRLGSYPYLLPLHYHGTSMGLLMCLNEAMVPLRVGFHPLQLPMHYSRG